MKWLLSTGLVGKPARARTLPINLKFPPFVSAKFKMRLSLCHFLPLPSNRCLLAPLSYGRNIQHSVSSGVSDMVVPKRLF